MGEPLSAPDAKRRILDIINNGSVRFSGHAQDEMASDGLGRLDCANVLRGGVVEPAEWEHGSWRYQVRMARITVVIAFRSETELVVVTAWRQKR